MDSANDTPEQSKPVQQQEGGTAGDARKRRSRSGKRGLRRNIRSTTPRNQDWGSGDVEEWDESEHLERDRIMPEDERDRRRRIQREALGDDTGSTSAGGAEHPVRGGVQGVVVSVTTAMCDVELEGGVLRCRLRGRLSGLETGFTTGVAVGDIVVVSETDQAQGLVEEVLPRRTMLTRPDAFSVNRRQLMVANADQLLIVSSWREPLLWPELIDRCLIAADISELEPVICVNKADFIEDDTDYMEAMRIYEELGHQVIRTSATTGEGVEKLASTLEDCLTALTGLSGTGKSSLISRLQPGLGLRTGEISEWSGEGRHTTSRYTLHRLDIGGAVVDTPGIREFGLSGLRKADLADWFPDMADFAAACRFNNCTHLIEPGCAVLDGVAEGAIAESRYHSYEMIYDTLPE